MLVAKIIGVYIHPQTSLLILLLLLILILFSVLALEASLGGVAGEGLGAESTFDRNNLGQVIIAKLSNNCSVVKYLNLQLGAGSPAQEDSLFVSNGGGAGSVGEGFGA